VVKLLRIAVILHSLEESYKIIRDLDAELDIDKFELTEKLMKFCDSFKQDQFRISLIEKETIQRANLLLDISNKTKLLFAGYEIEDLDMSFDDILSKLYQKISSTNVNRDDNDQGILCSIYPKILKWPGKKVSLKDFSKKFRLVRETILKATEKLNEHGLGQVKEVQTATSRKKNTFFFKTVDLKYEQKKTLLLFGVSLEDYIKSLQLSSNDQESDASPSKKLMITLICLLIKNLMLK
jgi:hypothetical protein